MRMTTKRMLIRADDLGYSEGQPRYRKVGQ